MVNLIIFIIIVLIIIVISIMYLKSIQINNTETRYNIVIRLLIVILLTVIFLENKQQSTTLSQITDTMQTYLSDAGKTMVEFIDNRTKDISNKLNSIDNKLTGVNQDISSINENINNSKESIFSKLNEQRISLFNDIQRYIQQQINLLVEQQTKIGPGGIITVW